MAGFITQDHAIVGAKSETTYGTDAFGGAAPSGAEVLAMAQADITQIIAIVEGDRITATFGGECDSRAASHNEVEWSMPLIGSSAAGALPPCSPLFKAAGFTETVVADTSVTYAPQLANNQTETPACTMVVYERSIEDGTARKLLARGMRTNLSITLEVGAEAMIGGSGIALYDAYPTSPSALPTLPTSYSGDQCAWFTNKIALTVDGTVYPCEGLTLETNNEIQQIMTGETTGGGMLSKALLTKAKSGARYGGSFTLADGATALAEVIAHWQSGEKITLEAVLTKGSRTITISGTAQIGGLEKEAPRFSVPYSFVRPDGESGVDHFTIVME